MAWRDESGGDAFDVLVEDVLARPVNLCATGTTPGATLPVRLGSGPAAQVVTSPLPQWPYRFEVGVSPRSPTRHCRPRAGLTIAPLTAVILHQAPAGQLGAASSLNQGMQQLGGAVGLAVLTTIFGSVSHSASQAHGITPALLSAVAFPTLALILFATWARRTTA